MINSVTGCYNRSPGQGLKEDLGLDFTQNSPGCPSLHMWGYDGFCLSKVLTLQT